MKIKPIHGAAALIAAGLIGPAWAATTEFAASSAFGPTGNGLSQLVPLNPVGQPPSAENGAFAVTAPSGRIYVLGLTGDGAPPPNSPTYFLERYNSDGTWDQSFGFSLNLATAYRNSIHDLAVDEAHGVFYLAGAGYDPSNGGSVVVIRFVLSDGRRDSSFNYGSPLSFNAPGLPRPRKLALSSDGGTLLILGSDLTGQGAPGKPAKAIIAALNTGYPGGIPAQHPVSTFGNNGIFETALGNSDACDEFDSLSFDAGGNLYLGGFHQPTSSNVACDDVVPTASSSTAVVKLSPSGVLQSATFASQAAVPGVFLLPVNGSLSGTGPLRVQPDGKVAFTYPISGTSTSLTAAVSRLLSDGSALDSGFGSQGAIQGTINLPTGFTVTGGADIDPAGHFLLGGSAPDTSSGGGRADLAILELNGAPVLAAPAGSSSGGGSGGGAWDLLSLLALMGMGAFRMRRPGSAVL